MAVKRIKERLTAGTADGGHQVGIDAGGGLAEKAETLRTENGNSARGQEKRGRIVGREW